MHTCNHISVYVTSFQVQAPSVAPRISFFLIFADSPPSLYKMP